EFRTPLDYGTAAELLTRLALLGEQSGIIHVAGAERVSRFQMMQRTAKTMGLDASLVESNRRADSPGPEPRPADVSLSTAKLMSLFPDLVRPTLEEAALNR